jgi:hypothetical protein
MVKIRGADIRCVVCGAEPWPDDPGVRETFDLIKLDAKDRPTGGDEGRWVCEACPPRARVARMRRRA